MDMVDMELVDMDMVDIFMSRTFLAQFGLVTMTIIHVRCYHHFFCYDESEKGLRAVYRDGDFEV